MTTFLLVRHGRHDIVDDVLLGRSDPVGLSEEGRAQIRRLALFMARQKVDFIQTSPRLRCRETAGELAEALQTEVEEAEALDELDYGEWTGRTFTDLTDDPAWKAWNERRDCERPPGGERMRDVQVRVVRLMQCLAAVHPDACIALVTHAEVVRAALLHDRGIPLREFWRLEIQPGTVWVIERTERDTAQVEALAS